MLDRPAVRILLCSLNRNHGEPEELSPQRILTRHHLAVVVPDRLPGPAETFRFYIGKVYVDQSQLWSSNSRPRTFSTEGFRMSKFGSSCVLDTLRAMPRKPSRTACLAAANVPECHIAFPRLLPRLIPDSTTSTFSQW